MDVARDIEVLGDDYFPRIREVVVVRLSEL
jgi:hypothetical protein